MDRQTDRSVLRAAWSQLKSLALIIWDTQPIIVFQVVHVLLAYQAMACKLEQLVLIEVGKIRKWYYFNAF